jgi:CHAT domain-containing protein/tetratricopeptide (TPR) repeat protein
MFLDPTSTASLSLPPGWAFDPISSSLTDLVFADWNSPSDRRIFVHVFPTRTDPSQSGSAWEAAVRAGLPGAATRVERRSSDLLLVERPGRDGRPDQRWAMVRGPRLDVVIEQVGVPLGGALMTPELDAALGNLDVPANRHLAAQHEQSEWTKTMQAANQAHHAGNHRQAVDLLARAREIATDAWLHSLTGRPLPEIPAAMAGADSALALAELIDSAAPLQQATQSLYRCRRSLLAMEAPSVSANLNRVSALLDRAMILHGRVGRTTVPRNSIRAALVRSEALLNELTRILGSPSPKIGGPWATWAVEDAMTAVVWSRLHTVVTDEIPDGLADSFAAQGITDKAAQVEVANKLFEITALRHLVAAGAGLHAARAFAAIDADRSISGNWVLATRRLAELSPSPAHTKGLALALNAHATAFMSLGDMPSLTQAEHFLSEAQQLLDEIGEEGELRAQICLTEAWFRHYRRQLDGSLAIVDRAIAVAQQSQSARIERSARSLRSQFLINAGRHDEAIAEAQRVVDDPEDDAPSAHRLNLAIALHAAGKTEAALEEVRTGLSAAIADEPLGTIILRLLFVGAALQEVPDPVASLTITEAAETVLDVLRMRISDAVDRVSFDDAEHHREVASTLVQRRLAADDSLGALATADRHRARSLIDAIVLRTADDSAEQAAHVPPAPPEQAKLSEQICYLTQVARDALRRYGVPLPLDGPQLVEMVNASGRTAVLFHPAGNQLLVFLVRPGQPSVVASAVSSIPLSEILKLTESLRAQLGIVVAARAARGELPAQSISDLTTALADDDETDESDVELDRLRRSLHSALFEELLPLLVDQEPLVMVPYRELAVIPLATLLTSTGESLADRHAVSVLPSLASLGVLPQASDRKSAALVVGNPIVSAHVGLEPLPGAVLEAREVDRMLAAAGMSTTLLLEQDATESAFRSHAPGTRVVHLACHAALREPVSASPLFLTPEPPDDGLLLPEEIRDLRLDGALVVLAACQSGLGRATADGVLGLGRAFIQAGARATVLSLWRVSDGATARLMRELYAGLLGTAEGMSGPLDLSAALRRAQLATRDTISSHPSSWGAWLIVGDGGLRIA